MNKSESKYFHTAQKMDEALLALLSEKDLDYITVKEICKVSGVSRSTFYLHYETIGDLLLETAQYITDTFYAYFQHLPKKEYVPGASKETLVFITPEYLTPWLSFIRDNKLLYRTVVKRLHRFSLGEKLLVDTDRTICMALEAFGIPESRWKYWMAFYLEGVNAIVIKWLQNDCQDSLEEISQIIQSCVRPGSNLP
ncbi:MAG TPA: TetR/AcrR family transcriptional regulator [Candidatus Faecousia excrementigallinarum]|uniref:TetR/AcrR family transcriptional regulator n=1 Tax=Candidatus Faecousia excrementigallinarum TaxID=2840806 RepID=A0A9D1CMI4_9FIRM|nr:TetR/AcrR family transcriptional regulator [Candidatus Faecousia excrementigallinarum]